MTIAVTTQRGKAQFDPWVIEAFDERLVDRMEGMGRT